MQKNIKRMLSLLLTMVMVFGLLPPTRQVFAAIVDTEAASDMLASASYDYSAQNWTGREFSYDSASTVTNGANSLRSWKFSVKEKNDKSYGRLRLNLNASYDLTNQDLVFDVKADPAKELTSYTLGIVPYNAKKEAVHDVTNYKEYEVYFTGDGWHTITIPNGILKAFLLDGKDLKDVSYLHLSFTFPGGSAQNIYIDNMHLEDHGYGTNETDAAADLLAGATVVSNEADGSTYIYEHKNTTVAYGKDSNSSHKFAAAANASNMFTVKYDLGESYDLNNKNIVLDMLSYRGGNGFAVSLYNSQNQQVSYAECYTTVNQWAQIRPAILAGLKSGKNLSDVRYIAIGARFASNTDRADRAFYVDNVRIENIDVYSTALQNKNIVFMGDSITASYGYKGWSGELEEHYLINKYRIGVGGASFATCDDRTTIYAQRDDIPNVDVDFFVLNGGVNDVWSKANLGGVSNISVANATVNSFDTNTTAGAMEQMFCYLTKNYPNAKVAFLINYICYNSSWDGVTFRDKFAPLAKQICEKWGVSCLDMSTDTTFNGLYGVHTYDGVHGNDVGYEIIMRKMAPWLISLCDANEQTEQNSDLLAYATYAWSESTWNSGALSYDNASTDVSGSESLRSWKFSATSTQSANASVQLQLNNLDIFTMTGKKLQFDVKFEGAAQKIGIRLYDKNWTSVTGAKTVWVEGDGSAGWQTLTADASQFESVLASGCSLDDIRLIALEFDFVTNKGKAQTVTVDNFRVVSVTATEATEQASDLLYGAGFVEGSMAGDGLGFDQFNTTFLKGKDSKYSLRFFAEDDKTAWGTATFKLPKSIDLRETTLQFNVNQYNQAALWVDLYDSNYKKITGDNYTLRAIGWQTYEVNSLFGLESGRTAEDLKDVRYIKFSLNLEPANTGRTVVIDNLSTYSNVQYDSAISGLTGLYLGDSISEAHNYKGWPGEMAEHYGVNGYNVSVGGRTLANDGIYNELANAPKDMEFDFVMLNGVVNDYFASIATGTLTPDGTTTFDGTTAIGGLEKVFHAITTRYPDAEVVYILNFVPDWSSFRETEYLNDFIPQAKKACEKWGVHCLDLVDNDPFLAEFDVSADVHTFDGLHPNKEGFDVITPYVVSFLESIFDQSSVEEYWTLEQDETVDLSLSEDLYVDLNGHKLTGIIQTNGYKVYVIDSATDRYTCNNMGYFNCVDAQGNTVAPEAHLRSYKNGTVKRYLSILTEDGYTLHRFYAGITKQSLAPSVTGVGYKAEFYADEMVLERVDSIGYDLWLEGYSAVSRSTAFKNALTLRVNNFDVENFGETNLYATAFITVDGEKIASSEYCLTFRQVVETVNANFAAYSKDQKVQVQEMVKANQSAMTGWEIANILRWSPIGYRGERFSAAAGLTKYITNVNGDVITPIGVLSFDYKLDDEAAGDTSKKMSLILRRASDGNWVNNFESYSFGYDGVYYNPANITSQTLEDGYIHVEIDLSGLAYDDYGIFDVYGSWTNVGGYIDNIRWTEKQKPMRGQAFKAGESFVLEFEGGDYSCISFDYKITNGGEMALFLRGNDVWVNSYGNFNLNANGAAKNYDGVTIQKLDDGYIHVTLQIAKLTDIFNAKPNGIRAVEIFGSWSTAEGYMDNLQLDQGGEPSVPETPADRSEAEAFTAGVTKTIYLEQEATDTISFEYKLTTEGKIYVILRDSSWTKFYGDFTFDANGLVWAYQTGITCEKLEDGYIRVTMNLDELNRTNLNDNRDNAPASVGIFDIYEWGTASGYVDNIQFSAGSNEPETPEIIIRGDRFDAGAGWSTYFGNVSGNTITPAASLSFDYKLDESANGDSSKKMALILRRASSGNWTKNYVDYSFGYAGARYTYDNVTCEVLDDGYIHVTIDLTGLDYDDYGVFDVYGSWCNVGGYIDNIQWTAA
ncbi:MAG: SGNH/GDSL hydrolase family protein [Oscillospiraceae bacterium]|nr:SGNH/GDSL hydrolase family protein [Oscillospiraceae bacterium]